MSNADPSPKKTALMASGQSLLIQMGIEDTPISSGTAFMVALRGKQFLVTNRHNVTGRNQDTGQPLSPTGGVPDRMLVAHNLDRTGTGITNLAWITRFEPLYDDADTPLWYEHPTLGARADFVALELTNTGQIRTLPYDLDAKPHEIPSGLAQTVSVIGFPFGTTAGGAFAPMSGAQAIWTTGFVATETDSDYEQLPIFLIDCRTRPGQSGSPVISYRADGTLGFSRKIGITRTDGPVWNLLGIYSGRIHPDSDIGMVWKVSAIRELIESIPESKA